MNLNLGWAQKYLLGRRKILRNRCWVFTGALSSGYGCFRSKGRLYRVHVVAALIWKNRRPKKLPCVCHECDNRRCFNPDHLYYGTFARNSQDMIDRGRGKKQFTSKSTRGERHWGARLNRNDIVDIRRQITNGRWGILTVLAKRYGVTVQQISRIKHGKVWRWLQCA